MLVNPYTKAVFLKSAAKVEQLPADLGYEVAFAGRSNAGKSSALNCLTNTKNLARTSKTPGRTQLINLFNLDEERRPHPAPHRPHRRARAARACRRSSRCSAWRHTAAPAPGLARQTTVPAQH